MAEAVAELLALKEVQAITRAEEGELVWARRDFHLAIGKRLEEISYLPFLISSFTSKRNTSF